MRSQTMAKRVSAHLARTRAVRGGRKLADKVRALTAAEHSGRRAVAMLGKTETAGAQRGGVSADVCVGAGAGAGVGAGVGVAGIVADGCVVVALPAPCRMMTGPLSSGR